jgi:dihydropteroate synthase
MKRDLTTLLGGPPPWIMGILNVTPDSFSDGGRYYETAAAIAAGRRMREEGAAVVDVGGESTAPGSRPIAAEEEQRRVLPVVEALAPSLPLSIDTYRASTARRGLALGAVMVNDVSALRADPDLARVVADHGAALVLMHAKDAPLPHVTDRPAHYRDIVAEIGDFLLRRAEVALAAGVREELLLLDPGWGRFISLDPKDSFQLLRELPRLVERLRPFPVVVGVSRKGFIGGDFDERDALSQFLAVDAIEKGAALVRTHNVRLLCRFLRAASQLGRRLPEGFRFPLEPR